MTVTLGKSTNHALVDPACVPVLPSPIILVLALVVTNNFQIHLHEIVHGPAIRLAPSHHHRHRLIPGKGIIVVHPYERHVLLRGFLQEQ